MIYRKRKHIEGIISELLRRFDVKGPHVPVKEIAEKLGLRVEYQPFDGDLSGILVREATKAVIGVNSNHPPTRRRFTIAHELGHFLLHEGDRVFVDRAYKVSFRNPVSSEGTNYEEIEANNFASWLLIPEDFLAKDLRGKDVDIDDEVTVQRLATRYKVSPQAMLFRLMNRSGV